MPVEKVKYSNIRRVGPESLRHFKRTFREALKRQVALGLYNPTNPLIVPIREDRRYRSWHVREVPESNAVIILCMDVSGSMGDQQKEIVRVASFWIDTWLRSQYKNLDNVYIVHEAFSKEVDQHTFYHLRESGGTKISTAYELINAAIDSRFSPDSWNIYLFHFSDGENGDSRDTDLCMEMLRRGPAAEAEPLLLRTGALVLRRRAASRTTSRTRSPARPRSSPARSATRTRSTTRSSGSWGRGCSQRDHAVAPALLRRVQRAIGGVDPGGDRLPVLQRGQPRAEGDVESDSFARAVLDRARTRRAGAPPGAPPLRAVRSSSTTANSSPP